MNWKSIGVWGLVLGASCVVWQIVMGLTGWYRDPALSNVFFVVVLINIVVIILALRSTRAENGYGKQVLTGLMVGLIGGVIIFGGSLLFTSVIAPDYANEVGDMQEMKLAEAGMSAEQAAEIAEKIRNMPLVAWAIQGFFGTVITSLVVALLAAIGLRRKT